MNKVERIEKQIAWFEKQIDHPLLAHLLGSLIIFWVVGFVMLLIDSKTSIIALSSKEIIDQLIAWTSIGLVFGISNRWYANYQIKRLHKKKEQLLSQNE